MMISRDIGPRHEYHGTCSADFGCYSDGECYECMFWVDNDCPYLINTKINNPKLKELVEKSVKA